MAVFVAETELASHLPNLDEPRVVTQGSFGTPRQLLSLVDAHYERYRLVIVNALPGVPTRPGIRYETVFLGAGVRRYPDLDYYPSRLSLAPLLFSGPLAPDIVLVHTSRPIRGKVSLGIEVQVMPGALEAARKRGALVVAQVNSRMPFTHGDGVIDLDDIDVALEIDEDVPTAPDVVVDDMSRAVGEHVAAHIPNGASLQMGIGAMPEAALAALVNHRGLRVWTELLTEGFKGLLDHGALDADAPVTATFMYGSQDLYDWADDNPQLQVLRCERTNSPGVIAQQRAMHSVNTALQVDLFGQVNASRVHDRIISGTGGQTDFIIGALHSPGGRAMIALRSWHPKADVSTIVPKLTEAVTSVQPSMVLSEYGAAQIYGAPQQAQAEGLTLHVAHPDVRQDLWAAGQRMGLIPSSSQYWADKA